MEYPLRWECCCPAVMAASFLREIGREPTDFEKMMFDNYGLLESGQINWIYVDKELERSRHDCVPLLGNT